MLKGISAKTRVAHLSVALASTFLMASSAHGADSVPVTLTASFNESLTSGESISGQIPLESFLSDGAQKFELSDFDLTVSGSSPETETSYSSTDYPYELYSQYEVSTRGGYVTYSYYTRYNSEIFSDNIPDIIVLSVGTDQKESADSYQSDPGPYLETGYTVIGTPNTGESYYITNTNIVNQGYYGALNDSLPISASTAASINSSGYLNFSLTDLIGVYTTSALNLTFEQTPISAAPEPPTWAMMLMAVGVVGLMLRRKTKVAIA